MAVRCASLHEKMFLRRVLAEFMRNGLEEAVFKQVSSVKIKLAFVCNVRVSSSLAKSAAVQFSVVPELVPILD